MQTPTNISLVLTDSSSLKRFADSQDEISYGGFYQRLASELVKRVHTKHAFRTLGERLVALAEDAHAFRQMGALEQVSQVLMNSPVPRQFKAAGQYYQALCIQRFGLGDLEQAARMIERVAECAAPGYRVRAIISLGANSFHKGDSQSALSLYCEAGRLASLDGLNDPYATIHIQKMIAIIDSLAGNQRDALALLENLFPLADSLRSSQPHVYSDYMNSLAVELCKVGRLEEARNASRIALASPFAGAYPEWRETSDEIELRGYRASRSTVAVTQKVIEARNEARRRKIADEAGLAVTQENTEAGNIVTLPTPRRDSPVTPVPAESQQPARVIEFPSRTLSMSEQNDKEQLDPSEKRRFVADKLYEMFMANLEDRPIDVELVEKLWKVYVESRKKAK